MSPLRIASHGLRLPWSSRFVFLAVCSNGVWSLSHFLSGHLLMLMFLLSSKWSLRYVFCVVSLCFLYLFVKCFYPLCFSVFSFSCSPMCCIFSVFYTYNLVHWINISLSLSKKKKKFVVHWWMPTWLANKFMSACNTRGPNSHHVICVLLDKKVRQN